MERPNFESRPHHLARQYETDIKRAIQDGLDASVGDLELLTKDQHGVYFSQENPNTLCCLVLGLENGHLYLVTFEISDTDDTASNFRAAVIS